MAAPPRLRTSSRTRESSIPIQPSHFSRPHAVESSPVPAPYEERFPQPTASFSLAAHARTASTSSSTSSTRSSNVSVSEGGGGLGRLPRTTSSSTWGDYSHDVELLLGEEGRGKSPSRNGPRSVTPSRSNSQLSQQSRWTIDEYGVSEVEPSTPKSGRANGFDDRDTTPRGQAAGSSSSSRPLHTPPQILPPSVYGGTSSPGTRSRMSSLTSSSSALRPPSAQSHSSNSSTYSLEDTSWATDLAPPLHSDDEDVASPRSPLLAESLSNQARPLSEFDFAAAYARSDGGESVPNSPLLPTVGIVRPASPVAGQGAAERFSRNDLPASTSSSPRLPLSEESVDSRSDSPLPLTSTTSTSRISSNLLQAEPATTTPSSSRAPSPTPSLSPNLRPSSRASSTTSTSRSVSSPVRPPRRQASSLSLVPKSSSGGGGGGDAIVPLSSPTPSASSSIFAPPLPLPPPPLPATISSIKTPTGSTASVDETTTRDSNPNLSEPGAVVNDSSTPSPPPATSTTTTNPNPPSPRGSPNPPSIPEKSRRRASTLGLGLRRGHAKNQSRDLGGTEQTTPDSRPSPVLNENGGFGGGGGGGGGDDGVGSPGGGVTSPNTPLSASDFADVYGKLDDTEWEGTNNGGGGGGGGFDTRSISTFSSSSVANDSPKQRKNVLPSTSSSSDLSLSEQPPSPSRGRHVRDAAASFDTSSPVTTDHVEAPTRQVADVGLREADSLTDAESSASSNLASVDTGASRSGASTSGTEGGGGSIDGSSTGRELLNVASAAETSSGSTTPRGDAKARAAAFIADLKKSRQEGENQGRDVVREDEDETVTIQRQPVFESGQEATGEEDTVKIPAPSREERPTLPDSRTSESSRMNRSQGQQPRSSQPSSRSSTLLPPSRTPSQPAVVPLLRRRPLPSAIQANGELQRARTSGERARIYATKINELNREKSRLDEWIDAVRNPRLAVVRASVTSPTSSPLKTARSFRQDASTATFAPRGDGYRAKEIVSSTFGPRDLQPSAPYPGVLSYNYNYPPGTVAYSATSSFSTASQRSLGSGLPSISAQPGSSGGGGGSKPSFFSRSLGRRTSKRDPPSSSSSSSFANNSSSASAGGINGLAISNPSPLLYSSSSTTTTAPHNLRPLGGPRMPGGGGGAPTVPTLSSSRSFDSRTPTPTNSPLFHHQPPQQLPSSAASTSSNPHRNSISHGGTGAGAGGGSTRNLQMMPNSPNSFSSVSTSPSPLLSAATLGGGEGASGIQEEEEEASRGGDPGIDLAALARLADVLPQAPREELVRSLNQAGGSDDILAISIYLSQREAALTAAQSPR